MSFSSDDLLSRLTRASAGLLFPSETDASLEPFVVSPTAANRSDCADASPAELMPAGIVPADAVQLMQSLEEFFAPATIEAEWMNADERATARRFQTLVATLRDTLTDIQLFRTRGAAAEVFIVGRSVQGWAGVKTRVVET